MERLDRLIYLDNAATVFPKPEPVLRKMFETYRSLGVSPGRGGYDLAMAAEELVQDVRERLCRFFGADDPERVIFASNATDALNLVIQGMAEPGGHVVASRLDHNSVLRPLHHLQAQGTITYDLVGFDDQGRICPDDIARAIKPTTRMVILNHASNVLGTIQDAREVGRICREKGVPLILDAAQSAGLVPIRMGEWGVSAVAFTGHKSLLGPSGIGGLVLTAGMDIRGTRFGGTGVDSQSLIHTQSYPHRLECGTLNLLGIIGLGAGLEYVEKAGINSIREREVFLAQRLAKGISEIPAIRIHGPLGWESRLGVFMIMIRNMVPEDIGAILDGDYRIAVRTGLHCAPLAHQVLGTFPDGGVRFSVGPFNTEAEIDITISAVAQIAKSK